MKKKIIIAAVIVIVIAVGVVVYGYYFERVCLDCNGISSIITPSEPTNFSQVGTITTDNSGVGQNKLYLTYEKPGAPALRVALELDGMSVCSAGSGATPCMAMSITFDIPFGGKRALVEGISKENGVVLVRKLRRLEEGELRIAPQPGNVFIPWPQAVLLIEQCKVSRVMQTHSLDVYLDLKDGKEYRAVEPTIDEVFSVVNRTKAKCGNIGLATE